MRISLSESRGLFIKFEGVAIPLPAHQHIVKQLLELKINEEELNYLLFNFILEYQASLDTSNENNRIVIALDRARDSLLKNRLHAE